ncbi:MAG: type III-B CRISPR module RAMP protein Cmr1 [Fimbriimonadaceae bacterium]|nr:type III-B CRISPR module RAMP protein Cmr1 [Fimbriimonadaceae bacterium]
MRVASVGAPSFTGEAGRWTELADVRVDLATPMLGGGSRAGHPDLDQPFRPSAIRGALRRWWRATNVFASPADLRSRERALWGMADAEGPSSSLVRVEVDQTSSSELRILRDAGNLVPDYAKGILIEPRTGIRAVSDEHAIRILPTGSFRLVVSVRSDRFATDDSPAITGAQKSEVLRALAAWLLFGGIGARTRRGFGALRWEGFGAQAHLTGLAGPQNPNFLVSGFTSLVGAWLFLKSAQDSNRAWHQAIETLRDFRKGQVGAQRQGHGPNSHSPWPEADSIRQAQGVPTLRPLPRQTFPRAELGLPLQFRSARPGRQNNFGPIAGEFVESWVPTTNGQTRLASPVLVKPILWNGQWWAGLVLLTRGRIRRPGLTTDARGYPDNLLGVPGYAGARQPKDDILDVLRFMLGQPTLYGYTAVTLP